MELESLKLEKFKNETLNRKQMFQLNGGGTATPGGSGCGYGTFASDYYTMYSYDFGYDAIRTNPDGTTYTTYHNRTNVKKVVSCE